jgi:hypothetical protein
MDCRGSAPERLMASKGKGRWLWIWGIIVTDL